MDNFTNNLQMSKILNILQSSKRIEKSIYDTYKEPTFKRLDQRNYKKLRTLLNRELYLLIEKLNRLPSVEEFIESYEKNNITKFSQKFSEESAIYHAYSSLVRDLHFYFILIESNLFDIVEISYLFDLQGQTDILLSKGNKKLGLQLFWGDTIAKERKKKHYKKFVGTNNYELYFFGTKHPFGERKILVCNSGIEFTLYSQTDAKFLAKYIENTKEVKVSWDINEENKYDDFINPNQLFITNSQDSNQENSNSIENEEIEFNRAKHSILYIGRLVESKKRTIETMCLKRGLSFYHCNINIKPNIVYDGIDFHVYGSMINDNSDFTFNLRQYLVEHASPFEKDIIVSAGAGSGKTYTLVSRTLFLLHMGYIDSVHKIAMITFTNEAANNMREKLSERFLKLYKQTGNKRYLKYLDELVEMKIMTIPAFARYILIQFGHFLGIGQNFQISNMLMDKRNLIDQYVNKNFQKSKIDTDVFGKLEYYQIKQFIEEVYTKIESKGIEMQTLFKGAFQNDFANLINDALIEVDKNLDVIKKDKNTFTLNDLGRYLTKLFEIKISIPIELLRKQFEFLFIDEFQDSDNVQIDYIVEIVAKANIRLLLVGDTKQGIYRFRGANVTAFQHIKERLESFNRSVEDFALVYNYRTSGNLLNKMENRFDIWRKLGLLNYDANSSIPAQMLPVRSNGLSEEIVYKRIEKDIKSEDIETIYKKMTQRPRESSDEKKILAILVRKNEQARKIGELLKSTKNLDYQVVLDGTLFQSDAAKDLLFLLYSWLEPDKLVAKYVLSQTAFCHTMNFEITLTEDQDYFRTNEYTYKIPKIWEDSLNYLKVAPALMVLNDFLNKVPYRKHLEQSGVSKIEIDRYELNLFKIISLMNNAINNDQASLYSIYEWLKIEHNTNTRDDEVELNDSSFSGDYIKVMTVHKSKGLEFDTVIIPFIKDIFVRELSNDFNPDGDDKSNNYRFCEIIVEYIDKKPVYGWKFYDKKTRFYNETPEQYRSLKGEESMQLKREETRNLYVAMTRAKEQLFFFGKGKPSANLNSWLDLLGGGN